MSTLTPPLEAPRAGQILPAFQALIPGNPLHLQICGLHTCMFEFGKILLHNFKAAGRPERRNGPDAHRDTARAVFFWENRLFVSTPLASSDKRI